MSCFEDGDTEVSFRYKFMDRTFNPAVHNAKLAKLRSPSCTTSNDELYSLFKLDEFVANCRALHQALPTTE